MTEYRVVGTVGDVKCMTEWLDVSKAEVIAVIQGLNIRGWKDTQIEERNDD